MRRALCARVSVGTRFCSDRPCIHWSVFNLDSLGYHSSSACSGNALTCSGLSCQFDGNCESACTEAAFLGPVSCPTPRVDPVCPLPSCSRVLRLHQVRVRRHVPHREWRIAGLHAGEADVSSCDGAYTGTTCLHFPLLLSQLASMRAVARRRWSARRAGRGPRCAPSTSRACPPRRAASKPTAQLLNAGCGNDC